MMLVSIYTSRVVLEQLGDVDFGIYNVVGGVVVLFTFVKSALVTSTQRFLNYELGRGDNEAVNRIFSASMSVQIAIAFITLLLAETVGLWFFRNYIQYPEERETAAMVVYQFSVLSTCVGIVVSPYSSVIIAYERMSFYAYISIFETALRLVFVLLLARVGVDKLIFYAGSTLALSVVVAIGNYVFCKRKFDVCDYRVFWDGELYKRLIGFSGWSLFGAVANLGASQGGGILLNMFFGVTINAAMGIANQVQKVVYQFVQNFQTAFNPQIIKSYAAGERDYFLSLIKRTSKYSYFLIYVISLPIIVCCEEVLTLWLGDVPEHSVAFCRLILLFSLLDAIQGPLWVSVQATGRIRNYQILMSALIIANLPISYAFLKLGYPPETVLGVRAAVNMLIFVVRWFYLRHLFDFPILAYLKEVVWPCGLITAVSFVAMESIPAYESQLLTVAVVGVASVALNAVLIYLLGLDSKERELIKTIIRKKCAPRR